MDVMTLVFLLVGLALLVVGAEGLVRGAAGLASAVGLSPLVIGLTVVAYGTSSPELAVSVQSALAGRADLALGNVVGSNIFNVLFILGASALIFPLIVSQQLVWLDVPLMIGASILMWLMSVDGTLGRLDGVLLLTGSVTYTFFVIRQSRRESEQVRQEYAAEYGSAREDAKKQLVWQIALVAAGLAALVVGSRWLVDAAIMLARSAGLSELVIGLTIVAAGTSLPEVATSMLASWRGERDIAVGNVVGSNIFNILTVLGVSSLVAPTGIAVSAPAVRFDIPIMIATSVACLPIFFTGHVIERWEGAVFLGYYVAYTIFLILAATTHDLLPAFSSIMLLFAIPLTTVTLLVLVWRAARSGAIKSEKAPPPTKETS